MSGDVTPSSRVNISHRSPTVETDATRSYRMSERRPLDATALCD